jgi:hypothetical protein
MATTQTTAEATTNIELFFSKGDVKVKARNYKHSDGTPFAVLFVGPSLTIYFESEQDLKAFVGKIIEAVDKLA